MVAGWCCGVAAAADELQAAGSLVVEGMLGGAAWRVLGV